MRTFVSLLFLASLFLSCDDTADEPAQIEPILIKYGTSFGECLGYCKTETQVKESEVTVEISTWQGDKKSNEADISADAYQQILSGIDFDKFEDLEEIIGCPDCADGGAEWLELPLESGVKRVTFEYQDAIPGIDPAIKKLRDLTSAHRPEVED